MVVHRVRFQDDFRAATTDLEDQGEEMYAALQEQVVGSDLMSDLEAARYTEVPLIVKSTPAVP